MKNFNKLKFYLDNFKELNLNNIYVNLIKKFGWDISNFFLDLHNQLKLK
jgi:hypothetical protein